MAANRLPALDFALGETADMLRETVEGFAASEIAFSSPSTQASKGASADITVRS